MLWLGCLGMEEGGVCMWDIRDIDTQATNGGVKCVSELRPTYTTEYAPDHDSVSKIVGIAASAVCHEVSSGKASLKSKWNTMQGHVTTELLCLSAWGHVTIMSIKELSEIDATRAEGSDWGLRIGVKPQPKFMLHQAILTHT